MSTRIDWIQWEPERKPTISISVTRFEPENPTTTYIVMCQISS